MHVKGPDGRVYRFVFDAQCSGCEHHGDAFLCSKCETVTCVDCACVCFQVDES